MTLKGHLSPEQREELQALRIQGLGGELYGLILGYGHPIALLVSCIL